MEIDNIYFGKNGFIKLDEYLGENKFSKIFILVDENTHEYCLANFASELSYLSDFEIIEIPSGEENKNISTVNQIWEVLTELKADRNSLMINIGGGVLTDMGAFTASTFKRGIKFINVPTTLLAMVDASSGGKTGIDLGNLKNQIGLFSFPEMVVINSDFLQTLDPRQMKSGLAEMLKHGLISNKDHWNKLCDIENLDLSDLDKLIFDSVNVKINIVEQDPTEKGLRKILNYGHTIGHAVETDFMETPNPLFHGEAVSVGMICEAYISNKLNMISNEELNEIVVTIDSYFERVEFDKSKYQRILDLMTHDKKNQNGEVNFSLLREIGNCGYDYKVSTDFIIESLDYYNS